MDEKRSQDSGEARGTSNGRPGPGASLARSILTMLAIALLVLIAFPFAASLVLAASLAGALHSWFERLSARIGGRPKLAAGALTLGIFLIVVLPLVFVSAYAGRELMEAVRGIQETVEKDGVAGLIADLPGPLQSLARRGVDLLPQQGQELPKLSATQGGKAAAALWQGLAAAGETLLKIVLMAVAFFFLLLDGKRLVGWIIHVSPFPVSQTRGLLRDFHQVSASVLVSSVVTAGVQTLIAFIGYLIAGVPRLALAVTLTFVIAFIPFIGAGTIVVAVAALLALSGKTGAAIFLALWGLIFVGLSDNVLKPYLIKTDVEIHGAVIFFALLGGLAVFGPIGLLVGPLIVAFFLATVRLASGEEAPGQVAPEPPAS